MVRRAVPADAAEITRLRRLMFVSMGLDCDAVDWEPACVDFFERHIDSTNVVAMVVDAPDGSRVAASGVIELPPDPVTASTPRHQRLHQHDLDRPRWRRRGLATAIMDALIDVARAAGTDNVELHATDQGRPLYERLGFVERPGNPALRLSLVG